MISFKLRKASHDKVRKTSQFLCGAGFVFAAVLFAYTAMSAHLRATSILSDHTVVDASLMFDRISQSSGSRGRTTTNYHFIYRFDANGRQREGTFLTTAENAERFLDADTIAVAYSNTSHDFERLELLQRNDSLARMLGRLLIALLVMGFVFPVLHFIVTAKIFVLREKNREAGEDNGYELSASQPATSVRG